MKRWTIHYAKCPSNYHEWRTAIVDAETAADAYSVLRTSLGDLAPIPGYNYENARPYVDPPASLGKVVRL